MKSKNNIIYKLKNTSFGRSNFYIFEYALMLGSLSLLLMVTVNMLRSFFGMDTNIWAFDSYNFDPESTLLALFAISLPIFVIFLQRTKEAEHNNPSLLNISFRKALTGIFLGVVTLLAILAAVALVNSMLNLFSIGMLSGNDNSYKESIYHLLSAILLAFTAWSFADSYSTTKVRRSLVMHNYLYSLLVGVLVVAVIFVIFPFSQSRLVKLDNYISGDLSSISSKINEYYNNNKQMPEGLNALNLSSAQNLRANNYNYSYEPKSGTTYKLCAEFLTKSDHNSINHPMPMIYKGVMAPYMPDTNLINQNNNPYLHNKGKQCFDMDVNNYNVELPTTSGEPNVNSSESSSYGVDQAENSSSGNPSVPDASDSMQSLIY